MRYFSPSVLDGSITTAKLADSAVTSPKIATSAVVLSKISDGSVVTAKIGGLAVRQGKIGTTANSQSGSITSNVVVDVPLDAYAFFPDITQNESPVDPDILSVVPVVSGTAGADTPRLALHNLAIGDVPYAVAWRSVDA